MYQSAFGDENKGGSVRTELEEIKELLKENKPKRFRVPRKAKPSKNKLKRGYIGVCEISDNKVVDFQKYPIIDGTIRIGKTIHVIAERDIFSFKGKPFIFQPISKLNPYNPLAGKHETYGHKLVISRVESEGLKSVKRAMGAMAIFGLIVAGIIAYYLFAGGSG